MKLNSFSALLLCAMFGSAASVTAVAQPVAPVKMVFASYNGPQTAQAKTAQWFMKEVTTRTNGRIVFETYWSGSLLTAPDLYPGVSRGAADIVEGAPMGYNAKDYPVSAVTIPYISDKFDAMTYAYKDLYDTTPELRQEFESKGITLLYAMAFVENTLWTNKRVDTRADLKGMRIRALSSIGVAFQELGATVVPMPFPDTAEALKRGALDGITASPFDASIIYGFHKIAPFVSDAGRMGVNAVMLVSINKKKLESLPPDMQATILAVADEATRHYVQYQNESVQAAAERFAAESNTKVVSLSDSESKAWREATTPKMREAWLAMTPDRAKASAMLDRYEALVHKYEAQSTYVTGIERFRKLKGQ